MRKRANKECWPSRERVASGGGREYPISALPKPAQAALLAQLAAEAAPALPAPVARRATPVTAEQIAPLTDDQRQRQSARAVILAECERLAIQASVSFKRAAQTLETLARTGGLPAQLAGLAPLANARLSDGRTLSARSILRWRQEADAAGVVAPAPKVPVARNEIPWWAPEMVGRWAIPTKPPLEEVYIEFCQHRAVVTPDAILPSIHQVRRFFAKLGTVTKAAGRMGPRALKTLKAYVKRDFSALEPNDVWSADGHTYDAEIAHPLNGQPIRPEITLIVDIAIRRVTGWSASLKESTATVAEALRHGVTRNGVPAIFYVDNGPGYTGANIGGPEVGLLGRIGTTIEHSLPYNSQARGVIERLHQSVLVKSARKLPTYLNDRMDDEARQRVFKTTRADLKAAQRAGKTGTDLVGASRYLIGWDDLLAHVGAAVEAYNNRPHSSLGGRSPNEALADFLDAGWSPLMLATDEEEALFRPVVERTTNRGLINWLGHEYFAQALEEWGGQRVQVAYDIHDASRVWVSDLDGRFICEAALDGHSTAYMPASAVQKAQNARADAALKRLALKQEAIESARPVVRIAPAAQPDPLEEAAYAAADFSLVEPRASAAPTLQAGGRPTFADAFEKTEWLHHHPDQITEVDRRWLKEELRDGGFRTSAELCTGLRLDQIGAMTDPEYQGVQA
jgi:putative transposase